MKKFSEMTQKEITSLSKEEFKSISPFEKKSCYDCGNLVGHISWWCKSKEAIEYRGTSIPGIIRCKFWKPDWSHIKDKYKTEENGYISISKNVKNKINEITNIFKKIIKSINRR